MYNDAKIIPDEKWGVFYICFLSNLNTKPTPLHSGLTKNSGNLCDSNIAYGTINKKFNLKIFLSKFRFQ
jgi:hypothetical protein